MGYITQKQVELNLKNESDNIYMSTEGLSKVQYLEAKSIAESMVGVIIERIEKIDNEAKTRHRDLINKLDGEKKELLSFISTNTKKINFLELHNAKLKTGVAVAIASLTLLFNFVYDYFVG